MTVRDASDPAEYKELEVATAGILSCLFFDLLGPVFRDHPDLAPNDFGVYYLKSE